MLAPLATLAFLVTLWLVTLVVADLLNRGLGKIVAALKGQSLLASEPSIRPIAVRISLRSRPHAALRAQPQLRAAA